jgi:hypothetical protein
MPRSLILVSLLLGTTARASIIVFTSRPAWQAAVGATNIAEDFSGFAIDTSFTTSPVAISGGTIVQAGASTFRNIVDVPPLSFPDNNGTSHASCFVNYPEGSDPGTQVRLAFTTPVRAYGFDTWVDPPLEGVDAQVYAGTTLLTTIAIAVPAGSFAGFLADAGEQITEVRLVSHSLTAGPGGEGFGLDNIAGATVPAPAAASVLALAGLGLARRRRS